MTTRAELRRLAERGITLKPEFVLALLDQLDRQEAEIGRLRKSLHDTLATIAFLRSVVASGESLNAEVEARMRGIYESARAALSESTPSSEET